MPKSNPSPQPSARPDRPDPQSDQNGSGEVAGQSCDFCGDVVGAVRRVALDVEYDRLQKIHQERYSCHSCFEAKEDERLGLGRR